MMNLNILEKLTRDVMKGNNIDESAKELVKNAVLSPVEHRSLSSLSWQIAASVRSDGTRTGTGATTLAAAGANRVWI